MRTIKEVIQDIEEIKKEIKLLSKKVGLYTEDIEELKITLTDLYDELEFIKLYE